MRVAVVPPTDPGRGQFIGSLSPLQYIYNSPVDLDILHAAEDIFPCPAAQWQIATAVPPGLLYGGTDSRRHHVLLPAGTLGTSTAGSLLFPFRAEVHGIDRGTIEFEAGFLPRDIHFSWRRIQSSPSMQKIIGAHIYSVSIVQFQAASWGLRSAIDTIYTPNPNS